MRTRKLHDVILDVKCEIERAEKEHPIWHPSLPRQILVVAKELGEAQKAALNIIEIGERFQNKITAKKLVEWKGNLRVEMTQTAAMAIRFLQNYDEES